jgi:hypothetical protein
MNAAALCPSTKELCVTVVLKGGVVSTGKSPTRVSEIETLGKLSAA